MGIRKKIWIGIGGLLLVLLLTSGSAIWVIARGKRALETVLRNNGDSVFYMHELTGALVQIHDDLKDSLIGDMQRDRHLEQRYEAEIERNLEGESQRITEDGEQELLDRLVAAWRKYKADITHYFKPGFGRMERRRYLEQVLEPQATQIKALAWQIAGLNLKYARFRDHGWSKALAEGRWMALLILSAIFLLLGLMVWTGRSILKRVLDPIQELTHSVHEISKGNLDLKLAIKSKDELGQLAAAFNSMAGRLKDSQRLAGDRLLHITKTAQMAISFSDPVAVFGSSGRLELCNLVAEEVFELKIGMTLKESSLAHMESLVWAVLDTGRAYEPSGYSEAFQIFYKGREKFVLPRLLPVLDSNQQVVGVTLAMIDVTALRKLDEMKSGLIATVSHQLKNPLTSLRMSAHLLLEDSSGPLTSRQMELAVTARDESDRLYSILEELLALGRTEAGKDPLQLKLESPRSLIMESTSLIEAPLKGKSLRLQFDIEDGLPELPVDAKRISHVFSNLYDNAIKYSPAGSQLQVGASKVEAGVSFWVRDSGPGISEAYQAKVFERFFRIPGRELGLGTGLGLAIAKEIVEMHGGSLKLESQEGKGSTFIFVLPTQARSLG
jgi:signal transduction histidine kinase/HAMP domain-containing protein